MALNTDFLNAMTREHVMKGGLVDNALQVSTFMDRLKKRGKKQWNSGLKFRIPLRYKVDKKGGAYGKGDEKVYAHREFATHALYEIKHYSEPLVLLNIDLNMNQGEEQIANLLTETIKDAMESMDEALYTDFFRDTSAVVDNRSIMMLSQDHLLDQTTSTAYGDIAANDFSGWLANVDSTTTLATLTPTLLLNKVRALQKGKAINQKPSIGVGTQTIFNKVEELEIDKQRGGYNNTLNLGVEYINVHGVPIIIDDQQRAGHLVFYNENYFFMFVLKGDDFVMQPWQESETARGIVSDYTASVNTGCSRRDVHGGFTGLV